jgi:glycosyltransferase involved in cell wall biosynthesis
MKIILVSGHPKDWDAGASTVFLHLDRELRALGHDVSLFHQEDYLAGGSSLVRRLMGAGCVKRQVLGPARGADVVEVAGNLGWRLFRALEAIPAARRPLRVTRLHGLEFKDEQARVTEEIAGTLALPLKYKLVTRHWVNRQEARTLAACDLVVCHSSREADAMVVSRLKDEKDVAVAPLGVDEEFFAAREHRSEARRLLWWGSWIERKGIADLPRAIRLARRARPELSLTVGGGGRSAEEVLGWFDPEDRPHVAVLPFVSRDEQRAALREHDVFLSPSLSEGFGLALLEAMAAGLPCITTLTGMAHDHLEHGINCFVVPMNGATALARAIERLAGDREMRRRLGAAAQETARALTWRQCAEMSVRAYAERLDAMRGRGGSP